MNPSGMEPNDTSPLPHPHGWGQKLHCASTRWTYGCG
jgi:hypothetical protein